LVRVRPLFPIFHRSNQQQCRGSIFQCSAQFDELAWQHESPFPESYNWNKKLETSNNILSNKSGPADGADAAETGGLNQAGANP
jgi:hypothetical protein